MKTELDARFFLPDVEPYPELARYITDNYYGNFYHYSTPFMHPKAYWEVRRDFKAMLRITPPNFSFQVCSWIEINAGTEINLQEPRQYYNDIDRNIITFRVKNLGLGDGDYFEAPFKNILEALSSQV